MSKVMPVQTFVDAGYMYIVNRVLHELGVELTINIAADGSTIGFGEIHDYNGTGVEPAFNLRDPNVRTKRERAIALMQRAQERQARVDVKL